MKKLIILIAVLLIALFIGGFYITGGLSTQEQIEIGNNTFTLPSGYHEGHSNKNGDMNITDGHYSVFISASKGNINKIIDGYANYISNTNDSVIISNYSVNNIVVYKGIAVNKTNLVRYWFEYNDTVYTVYTWTKNPNIDSIVSELINSINKPN